jgi:lipid-A-disaccharide synthase
MQQVLSAGVKDLPIHWVITETGASQVLTAADVALVASGTATLETALCHTPMVVGYRMHWLSHRIITAMLKTRWIALPNIIANRGVVPELLQSQATGAALAAEVSKLLSPSSELRQVQLNWFDTLHNLLHCNAAATAVTQLISWWRERVR